MTSSCVSWSRECFPEWISPHLWTNYFHWNQCHCCFQETWERSSLLCWAKCTESMAYFSLNILWTLGLLTSVATWRRILLIHLTNCFIVLGTSSLWRKALDVDVAISGEKEWGSCVRNLKPSVWISRMIKILFTFFSGNSRYNLKISILLLPISFFVCSLIYQWIERMLQLCLLHRNE